MTSEPVRDPRGDHLLTPQNCALVIIDYQPVQVGSIRSMDRDLMVDRVVHLARLGMLYRLPVVLSTVNVSNGRNQPTIGPLLDVLPGITALDRTTINAWEDAGFKQAVRAAGRRKLIMAALWTEACLTFPSLDAMDEVLSYVLLIWGNPVGQALLYGSLLVHYGLSLWSLWERRSLRLRVSELSQIALGFAIPILMARHVVGTRIADDFFHTHDSYYSRLLWTYFVNSPLHGYQQMLVLLVAVLFIIIWLRPHS